MANFGSGVRAVAVAAVLGAMPVGQVWAADPCGGYTWNVAHERALFAMPAKRVTAATTAGGPVPRLQPDKLYEIRLAPQGKVTFAMPPEKRALAEGSYAGIVRLHVPKAGKYRISMDQAPWIDVIVKQQFASTDDFTGEHQCKAPRKIAQFALPAGDLVLQFSRGDSPKLRVTLTAAPSAAR